MIGSGQWSKALKFQNTAGGCLYEWMCPLVLLKKNTQIREWWTHCAWPQIEKLPLERCEIPRGWDRGGYNGHGDHKNHMGGWFEYSWGSWLQSRKEQKFPGRRIREHDINHGLEMRQLRISMGGMTGNITQRTLDGMLWRLRRGMVCQGSLVF